MSDYFHQLKKALAINLPVYTFLHNTCARSIAEKIVSEGFEFVSHLDYSSDEVGVFDDLSLKYFTMIRQAYGTFTVIIQIDQTILQHIPSEIYVTDYHFSEAITLGKPRISDDGDPIYRLAPQFVKGFVSSKTGEFIKNFIFNPSFWSQEFDDNLNRYLQEHN